MIKSEYLDSAHLDKADSLRYASRNGYVEIVKILLAAGANVHAEDGAALRRAAENGHQGVR